jgi:hypothetical protein
VTINLVVLLPLLWPVWLGSGATAPQSVNEFRAIGELLVGRWTGQAELEMEYPGIGKKGDIITVYSDCHWAADGLAVECQDFDGAASATKLYVWDRTTRCARFLSGDSAGNVDEGRVCRQASKLIGTSFSTLPDGRRAEYAWEATYQGVTQTNTGSTTVAGRRTEWKPTRFRRVSP